ncbi:MAG: HVO_2922 family protein, partial [Haloarculaceae archaeon]
MAPESSGRLNEWYRNRIGTPTTDDEVVGYWLFALGVVLGFVGIALIITADLTGPVPQWPVVIVGIGLVLLIAGPIIRLPLRSRATQLVYLGGILSILAVPWFLSAYPGWRSQAASIVGLYAAGLAVMAIGGVFVPLLTGQGDTDGAAATEPDSEDDLADDLAESERAREELQAELDAAEAALAATKESMAQFELYEDNAGQWRWRLRHRNTNIIADSGEGYSSRQKAEQGMRSVQRNAAGAAITVQQTEEDEEEVEPVPAEESQSDFEIYEDTAGEWRWRLRHQNGNIIADSSQGYASRSNVERALESVREYVPGAAYLDIDPVAFEVYEDSAGEWRWRLRHQNGNVLADSG